MAEELHAALLAPDIFDAAGSALLEAVAEVGVLLETDGRIMAANQAAARWLGAPDAAGLIGTNYLGLLDVATAALHGLKFNEALLSGKPVRFEDESHDAYRECCFAPYRTKGSAPTGVALYIRDLTDYRRADMDLRREQQRIIYLMESLPGYIVLIGQDYHIHYANRYFRKYFGKSKGKRCHEAMFKRNTPCATCPPFSVFATESPSEWEWTNADGRTFQVYNHPMTDADGTLRVIVHGIDITARKNAEAELRRAHDELELRVAQRTSELRESESRYRGVVEDQTELICRFSTDRLIYFVNSAFCRFFNIERKDVIGLSFMCEAMAQDRVALNEAFDRLTFEEPVRTLELNVQLPNGETRWLRWTLRAIYDQSPVPRQTEYQAVGRDVTQLREAETRYFTLIQNLPIVIFGLAADLRVDFINQTSLHALGYAPAEAMAPDWFLSGVHPEDRPRVRETLAQAFDSAGAPFNLEFRFKHKKGYLLHLAARSIPAAPWLSGPVLAPVRIEGVISDVTERYFLDKVLRNKEKLNMLGAISEEMAHEIRNPLMALGGFARRLHDKHPDLHEVEIILEQAKRLEQLLDRIRSYLQPLSVQRQECQVNAVLTFCLDLLSATLDKRGLKPCLELDQALDPILSDQDILTQIFANCIANAAAAVGPGGSLTLKTYETKEHQAVDIVIAPLAVAVSDPERLFLPFDSDAETFNLAVSSRLVKNVGGLVSFKQADGVATVSVLLPKGEGG